MFARTQRLLLRPGWREDAPELFRAISDQRIVCNLATVPWPYGLEHAEDFLSRDRAPGDANLLVFRRTEAAPELIGVVGLGRRPDRETEFGYWIARRHWNRGYATEAGRALIAAARQGLRLKRLTANHFVDNPASGRVLEKLGFRPTGVTELRHSLARRADAPSRVFELELGGEDEPVAMAA